MAMAPRAEKKVKDRTVPVIHIDCTHLGPLEVGREGTLGIPEGPVGTIFGSTERAWVNEDGCFWITDGKSSGPSPIAGTVAEILQDYIELAKGVTTELWLEHDSWASFTAEEKTAALAQFTAVRVVRWPSFKEF